MRIVYVISSLRKGGPANQLFGLIKYLDRQKFEPVIVTLSREPRNSCRGAFEALGVEIFDAAAPRGWLFLSCPLRTKALAEKISPDIIHTHGIRADIISAFFLTEFLRVSTVHNFPFEDYRFTYGKIPGNAMARAHVKALSKIDAAVACSESICSWFREKYVHFSIQYIRNGVDAACFKSADYGAKACLREKLGIPKDALVFLYAGHLNRRKDPLTLIRAFRQYAGAYHCLFMLGQGELQNRCLKEAGDMKNIRFEGRVDNIFEFMRASDIFVSCSRAEGFPMAVLEAYSSGLFCILSDIAPHAEAARLVPEASALFKVGDFESLGTAFGEARSRIQKSKPAGLSELAAGHFSARRMSAEYQKLYYNLVEKGNRLGN